MKKILNNKIVTLIIGIIIIVLIIILSFTFLKQNNNDKSDTLTKKITELGSNFYEQKFYPTLTDKNTLDSLKDNGININLTNVKVLMPLEDELEKLLNNKECSLEQTAIIIYPKSPYGEKDYTIKVELACEK